MSGHKPFIIYYTCIADIPYDKFFTLNLKKSVIFLFPLVVTYSEFSFYLKQHDEVNSYVLSLFYKTWEHLKHIFLTVT